MPGHGGNRTYDLWNTLLNVVTDKLEVNKTSWSKRVYKRQDFKKTALFDTMKSPPPPLI
jgi:hypothetical protein